MMEDFDHALQKVRFYAAVVYDRLLTKSTLCSLYLMALELQTYKHSQNASLHLLMVTAYSRKKGKKEKRGKKKKPA